MSKIFLVYFIPDGEEWCFDSLKAAKAFIKQAIKDNPKVITKHDFDAIEERAVFGEANLPIFNG